ncbi:MAG: 23S rRNA (pseudouridine(1915)-N(3))-methyltransferase RlmH [bacterium]|uniref:Ribosomal RNA large subunit methyltransferase H n=2 Tax=Bacteria candidate phyla TaxID=1783234 RepID=A0A101I0U5_UNCT6|nr:MAG: Ribosomal RNA large subunit methyltransferase H [candidate division TA06 bacterium 32_111]KUK86143.1 MAG: Ribosomal RNA large subunit methyltransferase H [candidate division TA06 bacterium 34_109]MDI6700039.1 23S rRNA (pseudouridine(1915)-N(3))-methyltransferase RlmH [bacterium]HAF07711.1 23S rRNA (pseudouridine(1915)-N(3))-methyltransferase RlmH [candidate division WOR-3 bacterium]HCP17113.1 23S rRNA (pseudouridine(1915)-N(3))-methyltransferase RlmH [candidate division WOR-3 bacterium]
MGITILTVGKIKNDCFSEIFYDYFERIKKYRSVEIKSVKDHGQLKEDKQSIMEKESKSLIKNLEKNSYKVLLAKDGKMLDSVLFSKLLEKGNISFIIGGVFGVNREVYEKVDFVLSLSKMTFPHRIARIVLLEQIYRGLTILNKEKYHK